MNPRFKPNAPAVVSEIIDGEAVIMHLKSGSYYSTEHVGSQIWTWIEQGLSRAEMLERMAERYPVARQDLATSLDSFIAELVAQDLVRETAVDPVATPTSDPASVNGAAQPFAAPVLNVYSDMKDLLLLDPIHDVDEIGWPIQKPQEP